MISPDSKSSRVGVSPGPRTLGKRFGQRFHARSAPPAASTGTCFFPRTPRISLPAGEILILKNWTLTNWDIGCGLWRIFRCRWRVFIINTTTSGALERTHSRSKTETAPRKQVLNFQVIIKLRPGGGCAGEDRKSTRLNSSHL